MILPTIMLTQGRSVDVDIGGAEEVVSATDCCSWGFRGAAPEKNLNFGYHKHREIEFQHFKNGNFYLIWSVIRIYECRETVIPTNAD